MVATNPTPKRQLSLRCLRRVVELRHVEAQIIARAAQHLLRLRLEVADIPLHLLGRLEV